MAFDTSRLNTAQVLAASTVSAACTAFGSQTYKVRVAANTAVFFRISDGTPTATVNDTMMGGALIAEYFTVTPGQKLAAITSAGTGSVSVTELSS